MAHFSTFCKWSVQSCSDDIDVGLELGISILDELGWLEFAEWGVQGAGRHAERSGVSRLEESSTQHLDLNKIKKNG